MEYVVNRHLRARNMWPASGRRKDTVSPKHSDFLIVGAGIFGTSTAYHLSLAYPSATVTIVDRTPFPPRHAASTDINKIVRADYTSRFYMDLATEAMEAWNTWPDIKNFYHRTGWINFSAKGSDIAARIRQNYRDRGSDSDPTSDIDLAKALNGFGGIFEGTSLDGIESAYMNPEAGWCDAGAALTAMLSASLRNSRVRYVVADVQKIVLSADKTAVSGIETRSGELLTADRVLVAAGAWTSSLMTSLEDELNLQEAERIERQVVAAGVCVAHFRLSDKEMQELKEMPVVIYGTGGDGQPPPARSQLLKLTNAGSFTNTVVTATGHKITAPPDRDQSIAPAKLKEETLEVIGGKLMPKYTSRPVDIWRLCWDAVSPSQDHLITKHPHPQLGNLFFAIGGSFHSWKFLPTIGHYVVNVLHGKSNGQDKDSHWAWKTKSFGGRGAHEKAYPTRELDELEDKSARPQL